MEVVMSYLGRSAKLSLKAQEKVSFLATAGQTVKTGLSYTPSFVEVYVNGVLLTDTTDYTATNGNSVTFTVALLLNDEVTVISLKTFTVADHYTKSDADTLLAAKSPIASPSFTGNVGVNEASPLGNLHVKSGESGATVDGSANELVVEGSGNSGISILSGSSSGGQIYFGDSELNYDGYLAYSHASRNMTLGTAGAGRLNIDSAGIVTKPNQPAFRAGSTASVAQSVTSTIVFNTVHANNFAFNRGNHYSTSTGRFTAPVAGVYCFSSGVLFEGVTNNTDMSESLYLYRNGVHNAYSIRRAVYVAGTTGNGAYYADYLHSELDLAAGDYITIISRHAETTHGNPKYTFFQGHLIG
jgi:hypothetical protein